MRFSLVAIFVIALLLLPAAPALADGPLEKQALDIGKHLRCPVCQNLSVADSTSQLAEQMRGIIREKLEAGETREQVVQYFVDRYGESVLLEPPKQGFTLLAWWGPVVAMVLALAIVIRSVRRRLPPADGKEREAAALSPEELIVYEERLNRELVG
ncbi:MAG: CcmH, cytochrome c-type biosis protein CcmH [Dehalococcoidia bacterium]|nr:CcmH, cytochrome c-type biosis protein CcmH [Dehalococcoidia bacterium]